MSGLKEIVLPSGAILKIGLAPFSDAKTLYQAFLSELKSVQMSEKSEATGLLKDLLCVGLSSKSIEAALAPCLKRCLYNDRKITDESIFESVEARGDYLQVCLEVAKENILPFVKSLFAEYSKLTSMTPSTQA